jgi:two-component system chemotaxis response regulator CheY
MGRELLIADDSAFTRRLLRDVLEEEYEIVGEVANGVEAVDAFESRRPDVVVIDADLPIRDGVEATAEICEQAPETSVIVCARAFDEQRLRAAEEAGADGCVRKPFRRAGLLEAVRDATP